jgi:hypothetical protein
LGWKEKFGLPSQMVMEAIGVKNWRTYSAGLNELIEFGFIKMIQISTNQYSSNIIAIVNFTKADTKALDKALQKHGTKQSQSTVSINKQLNNELLTNNNLDFVSNDFKEIFELWLQYKKEKKETYVSEKSLQGCYNKLLKTSDNNPLKAKEIIESSIANNYSGFFKLKEYECEKSITNNSNKMVW